MRESERESEREREKTARKKQGEGNRVGGAYTGRRGRRLWKDAERGTDIDTDTDLEKSIFIWRQMHRKRLRSEET